MRQKLTDLLVGVLAGETLGDTGHDDVLTEIILLAISIRLVGCRLTWP